MKFLLVFAIFAASLTANAQPVPASANDVLRPAYAKATAEKKNVLLIFHASWCGWCKKMDASLNDASVKDYFDKTYVIEHLTVYESPNKKNLENPGALEFLTKMGGADKGLPYWIILDANGNKLADSQYKPGENTGCPASEEEVDYFIAQLKKTSTLPDDALAAVRKRFLLNK